MKFECTHLLHRFFYLYTAIQNNDFLTSYPKFLSRSNTKLNICMVIICIFSSPECRAEHRIPYQGVQAFPTNVTLQRFLELRMEITGEPPDPTSGKAFFSTSLPSYRYILLFDF